MLKNFILIDRANGGTIKNDILAGLTVALALIPEAIAFAFVAGVSPIIGLYGAFLIGIITAIFGGRPGMISGATGALAVVMVHLVREGEAMGAGLGVQFLFATLLLTGIIQILFGVLKLGKFIRMVPHSVMLGFVNGLAIVIFLSQLEMFQSHHQWLTGVELYTMLGLVLLTMCIMYFLPKMTKKIPPALVAIVGLTLLVIVFNIDTATVKSFVVERGGDSIKAGLPVFALPGISFLSLDNLMFMLPYAFILAIIGLVESLLTLNLLDELIGSHSNGNQECIAQGVGNITNGFFGGMGGCAMIGQSIINVKSGGRGKLSSITAAIALLIFIIFFSDYIELIPLGALVGVMFMVVIGTFAWSSLKILAKIPLTDALVIVIVTAVTVYANLAVAVITGVIVSALVFAWKNSTKVRIHRVIDKHNIKHYEVSGPLFFASTESFINRFDPANDPKEVIIDFLNAKVMDQSAIEAINKLADKYLQENKQIHLRHLSEDCRALIKKADDICDVNVLEDPDYFVAIDNYNKAISQ